jgi:hypothetical protein
LAAKGTGETGDTVFTTVDFDEVVLAFAHVCILASPPAFRPASLQPPSARPPVVPRGSEEWQHSRCAMSVIMNRA